MEPRKVIILGGGPAGLTAGIYTARANLEPLLLTGLMPGGQLTQTSLIENFPGCPKETTGPTLMQRIQKQAEDFGAEVQMKLVSKVDFSERPFKIYAGKEEFSALAVIIATGSAPRRLGVPGENDMFGRGVSTCATCDAALFKDKTVAIVGGGDSAMEEALFLCRFVKKTYLIHRRDKLRASKIMQERALANEKIEFVWNSTVEEVLNDGRVVTGVKVKNKVSEETTDIDVNGLFLAIGHLPITKLFEDQIDVCEENYILPRGNTTHTNVEGVFVCGDVADKRYRQAITAAGMGCKAAIDCERYLETTHNE